MPGAGLPGLARGRQRRQRLTPLMKWQLPHSSTGKSVFAAIPEIIAGTMDAVPVTTLETLQDVLEADQQAREVALEAVRRKE